MGPFGEKQKSPKQLEAKFKKDEKLIKVVSGENHTLILTSKSLYAFGDSTGGKIGRLPRESRDGVSITEKQL